MDADMTPQARLRRLLAEDAPERPLVAPGIYDAMGALAADRAGFCALYLSGASIAYSRLGAPDLGLVAMNEVVETVALIRERTDLPLVVDADTGFGNALNVRRTVRRLERAGASAIQLEDQGFPKRCGHLADKTLVSAEEMAGKIAAAVDTREDDDTVVIARTDAIAVEGLEPALDRAEAYVKAGADLLFVEAPRSAEELHAIPRRLGMRVPLLANMVEGGHTPVHSAADLGAIGYRLVIFPGGLARCVAATMEAYFASLRTHGSNAPFRERMLDFNGINDFVGTPDALAWAERYDRHGHEEDAAASAPASGVARS
jgi:2-methylisocitrate lyase-like PEP mutase family enzyme